MLPSHTNFPYYQRTESKSVLLEKYWIYIKEVLIFFRSFAESFWGVGWKFYLGFGWLVDPLPFECILRRSSQCNQHTVTKVKRINAMSIMILWMIFRDFHYFHDFHDYDNLPGQSGSLREPAAGKIRSKQIKIHLGLNNCHDSSGSWSTIVMSPFHYSHLVITSTLHDTSQQSKHSLHTHILL